MLTGCADRVCGEGMSVSVTCKNASERDRNNARITTCMNCNKSAEHDVRQLPIASDLPDVVAVFPLTAGDAHNCTRCRDMNPPSVNANDIKDKRLK